MNTVYTIGYVEYETAESMIQVLKKYEINCLIDVRSNPHSVFKKEFDKENLMIKLPKEGIHYRSYAREFGARRMDCLGEDKQVDFDKVAHSTEFLEGAEKLKKGLEMGYNFVLMCAEKEPGNCHRGILIGKYLTSIGIEVKHIINIDKIISQREMEINAVGNQISMFEDEDPVERFYKTQAKKIASRLEEW